MTRADDLPPELRRYHRQILLPGFGEEGQRRLRDARVLVVGCGALGTVIVDGLARAGVGFIRIVDRDVVEITNLQRQVLFDERDVADGIPKAEAARAKIANVNSDVEVDAHVDDFNHLNAERYADGVDLFLDGLDNFETRYLLNDVAVKHGLPYIYGGAVATTGMSVPIVPGSTPCLRCIFPDAPPPGVTATCDTAGVLGSVVLMVAAHQLTQAIKLLTGHEDLLDRSLLSIDAWLGDTRRFEVSKAKRDDCPCCGARDFEFLEGRSASATTSLCGRNAVQIAPPARERLDLEQIATRLAAHGSFTVNEHLLRGELAAEHIELTLFPDGRAIIRGTDDVAVARSVYAKYVGG